MEEGGEEWKMVLKGGEGWEMAGKGGDNGGRMGEDGEDADWAFLWEVSEVLFFSRPFNLLSL